MNYDALCDAIRAHRLCMHNLPTYSDKWFEHARLMAIGIKVWRHHNNLHSVK